MYYEKAKELSENTKLIIFDESDYSMCITDNQKEYTKATLDFVKDHKNNL